MTVEEQIKVYCEKKEEEKIASKEIKSLGADIKKHLLETDDKKQQANGWVVILQHKVVEDIDEEKLIGYILQYKNEHPDVVIPYLDYVPIVNMEKLESAIYNKEVPEDIIKAIDNCRVKKESDALVYKKVKGE